MTTGGPDGEGVRVEIETWGHLGRCTENPEFSEPLNTLSLKKRPNRARDSKKAEPPVGRCLLSRLVPPLLPATRPASRVEPTAQPTRADG